MKKLVAQPKKENVTMVEEFYNEAPENLSSPFTFRGVNVEFSMDNICDYYGLMNVDQKIDRAMRTATLRTDEVQNLKKFPNPTNE